MRVGRVLCLAGGGLAVCVFEEACGGGVERAEGEGEGVSARREMGAVGRRLRRGGLE